jgi:DNA-binding NtrC family response regulator
MFTPTLLIFERKPRWVPELERQFLGEDVRVRGCSSLSSLQDRLGELTSCVVILELAAAPAECLQALGRLMARSPFPTILVTASPAYRELEWAIREQGTVAFWEEPIPGDEMAKWCRRQFTRGQAPFA